MSVMVTLNVNSKLNVLAFDADDYEIDDAGCVVVLAPVDLPAGGSAGRIISSHETIATVRDWSAVSIEPTPPGEIVDMLSRALNGDTAAPCEKCADREERLRDSLARLNAKAFALKLSDADREALMVPGASVSVSNGRIRITNDERP